MQFLIVLLIAIFFIATNLTSETRSAIINDVKIGTAQTIKSFFEKVSEGDRK